MPTLFDLPLTTLEGKPASLADFHGRVVLVVNVASKCGFTPQYTGLEALYQRFKDRGLVIVGCPANDFGGQEPGSNADIARFCSLEYPVTFPLLEKMTVTGPQKHPLYQALITARPERRQRSDDLRQHLAEFAAGHGFPAPNAPPEVLWNFEKFLLDRQGNVIGRYNSDMEPGDPEIVAAIEAALG